MSEFERSRSVVPSFAPAARPDVFVQEQEDELEPPYPGEGPLQREGLPPGFRMRHDSHYVEQLTARTGAPQVRLLALREIDGPRPPDSGELGPLVRSIAKYGILQPLLVRPRGGRFELIAGTRRLAAAAVAGLGEVPCLVHQADDVRARALAEADNLQGAQEQTGPAAADSPQAAPPSGLRELARSFGTIGSCLHLLAHREIALRDRVALDLVRTEVHRAGRLVQSLDVIGRQPTLSQTSVPLSPLLDQMIESFAPERRLSGASVSVKAEETGLCVYADPDWLSVGLSGALGGVLAMVQNAKGPAIAVVVAASAGRSSAMIEIAQEGVTVAPWGLDRFFDPQWTERPGGYQAAVELAAARKVAELHRGGAEVMAGERGGCRLILLLPLA